MARDDLSKDATPSQNVGHSFSGTTVGGTARVHLGSNYNHYSKPLMANSVAPKYKLGLFLNWAPLIDDDAFIGRETELAQLQEWFQHVPSRQNIVTISGLGGIGKTQLSIHFAKQFHDRYSSIIWLNATNENTLKAGLVDLALHIQGGAEGNSVVNQPDEDDAVRYIRRWLSEPNNTDWLVIYDNYDNPQLPGIQSLTGYDIRKFFPYQAQGSILITTRSSRIGFGKQVRLRKLEYLQQSLDILANRSGREIKEDINAHRLAKRLDGLPIALSTAGTYIRYTASSFGDYLQMYEDSWDDLAKNSFELLEYENRTFYSTWNLSLKQVEAQDPEAAQMLYLIAYLSNLDLWYELFQNGAESGPTWLSNVVKSKARFNKAMGKLQEYSLVEVEVETQAGQYSLHTCVHDWTLEFLNHEINTELYCLAVHCIARTVMWETEAEFWVVNRRLLQHLNRLEFGRLKQSIDWNNIEVDDVFMIAYLNGSVRRLAEAEVMYQQALYGYEKAWGPEHMSTLDTVNNLGNLYKNQGKLAEAEAMYQRALDGYEKAWGPEHTSTLDTVNNLGNLYKIQGKLAEAEVMYQRAFEGKKKAWGLEHISTLDTVNNLGNLYADQGKLAEAEVMYQQALYGYEKAWGPEHMSTLDTVNNLGALYADQGKLTEAEAMYQQALYGYAKAWGSEHMSTLDIVNNLGLLYANQGKLTEAEAMYRHALQGYEKALGTEHISTLSTVSNLGVLYKSQGRLAEAEAMYQRALQGFEKAWGPEHTSTLSMVNNLGLLYQVQGKLAEAEQMYQMVQRGNGSKIERTAVNSATKIEKSGFQTEYLQNYVFTEKKIPATGKLDVEDQWEAETMSSFPNSVSSLESTGTSSTKPTTEGSTNDEPGIKGIVNFLIADEGLKPLYAKVLKANNVDGIRFQRNFQRLLRQFSTDIRKERPEDCAKVSLWIQSCKRIIASRIWVSIDENSRGLYDSLLRNPLDEALRRERLEEYTSQRLPRSILESKSKFEKSTALEESEKSLDSDADNEPDLDSGSSRSSGRGSGDEFSEDMRYSDALGEILRKSDALTQLRSNFRAWIDPDRSYLSEKIQVKKAHETLSYSNQTDNLHDLVSRIAFVPREHIVKASIIREVSQTQVDRLKISLETYTKQPWDWWPFTPPRKNPGSGKVRLSWSCSCGNSRETEIKNDLLLVPLQDAQVFVTPELSETPDVAIRPSPQSDSQNRTPGLADTISGSAPVTKPPDASFLFSPRLRTYAKPSIPISLQLSTPRPVQSSVHITASSSLGSNDTVMQNMSGLSQNSSPQATIQPPSRTVETSIQMPNAEHVLLGVNRGQSLQLVHIDRKICPGDPEFFEQLRREYNVQRGFFRRLFDVKHFHHCEFVQFNKPSYNRIFRRGRGYPHDIPEHLPFYRYQPTGLQSKWQDPPILEDEFYFRFYGCSNCMLREMVYSRHCLHFCQCPVTTGRVERIPKRIIPLELEVPGQEEAWGLHAIEYISVLRVIVYHVVMLVGPMVFWGLWLWYWGHEADLQNASVPLTCMIPIFSMFWGLITAGSRSDAMV